MAAPASLRPGLSVLAGWLILQSTAVAGEGDRPSPAGEIAALPILRLSPGFMSDLGNRHDGEKGVEPPVDAWHSAIDIVATRQSLKLIEAAGAMGGDGAAGARAVLSGAEADHRNRFGCSIPEGTSLPATPGEPAIRHAAATAFEAYRTRTARESLVRPAAAAPTPDESAGGDGADDGRISLKSLFGAFGLGGVSKGVGAMLRMTLTFGAREPADGTPERDGSAPKPGPFAGRPTAETPSSAELAVIDRLDALTRRALVAADEIEAMGTADSVEVHLRRIGHRTELAHAMADISGIAGRPLGGLSGGTCLE